MRDNERVKLLTPIEHTCQLETPNYSTLSTGYPLTTHPQCFILHTRGVFYTVWCVNYTAKIPTAALKCVMLHTMLHT